MVLSTSVVTGSTSQLSLPIHSKPLLFKIKAPQSTEELYVQADICPVCKINQPKVRNKSYLFQKTHSCSILSWDAGNDWDLVLFPELGSCGSFNQLTDID